MKIVHSVYTLYYQDLKIDMVSFYETKIIME